MTIIMAEPLARQLAPLFNQLGIPLGANNLPYAIPIHPNLVHFTLGLFIIAIIFDIVGTLFAFEKPILRFLNIPALQSGFYTVGWYNLLAAVAVTLITVAAGFFELLLANPPAGEKSAWGLSASATMIIHGVGGILLLGGFGAMAIWRGFQRYRWRRQQRREVQWSYLAVGVLLMGALYVHGTLGAQMGDDFGIHNTAANILRQGGNPNQQL